MSNVTHDGAPAPPVRVDPVELRRAGTALRWVGADLRADARAARTMLAGTADGTTGWAAAGAAAAVAREWVARLQDHATELDELGDRCVAAAEAYAHCDARSAARSGAAGLR